MEWGARPSVPRGCITRRRRASVSGHETLAGLGVASTRMMRSPSGNERGQTLLLPLLTRRMLLKPWPMDSHVQAASLVFISSCLTPPVVAVTTSVSMVLRPVSEVVATAWSSTLTQPLVINQATCLAVKTIMQGRQRQGVK